MKKIFNSTKKQEGMTLFIAVVIMGILLFISFAVVNITLKATLFASSGRDSQYAFYAADAGMECAIYWDSTPAAGSAFATSTPPAAGTISCAGHTISNGQPIPGGGTTMIGGGGDANPTSIFYFDFSLLSDPMPYCAIVTVTKNPNMTTYIKSRGYNTCDTSDPRRVERGIELY